MNPDNRLTQIDHATAWLDDLQKKTIPGSVNPFFLLAVITLTIFTACASSNSFQDSTLTHSQVGALLVQQKSDEYRIRAGDLIEISVWGYDEFNTERTVTGRGLLSVPLIGSIEARGLTNEELKDHLKEELSKYIQGEINISISITGVREMTVSVLGAVGRPDNYEILENVSLFEMLSRAGGTTDEADLRNITIYRSDGRNNPIVVDLTRYLRGGEHPTSIAPIMAGDIIYVPREENVVRELSIFMRDVVLLFGMFRIFN